MDGNKLSQIFHNQDRVTEAPMLNLVNHIAVLFGQAINHHASKTCQSTNGAFGSGMVSQAMLRNLDVLARPQQELNVNGQDSSSLVDVIPASVKPSEHMSPIHPVSAKVSPN